LCNRIENVCLQYKEKLNKQHGNAHFGERKNIEKDLSSRSYWENLEDEDDRKKVRRHKNAVS